MNSTAHPGKVRFAGADISVPAMKQYNFNDAVPE